MIGLIGPDGVGKSTLLGMIAGVHRIQHGSVRVLGGDIADASFRNKVSSRIAYLPQGLGKNLYPNLINFRERRLFRTALRPVARRARMADQGSLRQHRPVTVPRPSGRQALGRHEAEARAVLLADPRPGFADPRRAHYRRRSVGAAAILGTHRSRSGTPPGDERFGRDSIHGRGGAIRLARRDECRQGARHRNAGRTDRTRPTSRRWKRPSSSCCPRSHAAAIRNRRSRLYKPSGGAPAIEAHGLTQRFGSFTAVDHVNFRIERGRDFRLSRLKRLRQDHHDEDADRIAATDRRYGIAVGSSRSRVATSSRADASAS